MSNARDTGDSGRENSLQISCRLDAKISFLKFSRKARLAFRGKISAKFFARLVRNIRNEIRFLLVSQTDIHSTIWNEIETAVESEENVDLWFFHQTSPPGPLFHILKRFRIDFKAE
jgi:hypothetical protein